MIEDRGFCSSIIISLIIHGACIILIPGIKPVNPEDNLIGRYTKVQLIPVSSSLSNKMVSATHIEGIIPVPELSPLMKNRLNEFRDTLIPSFDLSLPPKKDPSPLPSRELVYKEDMLIEEKIMPESAAPLPLPQSMEVAAKRQENFPKPALEKHNFDIEQLMDEVIEDIPSDNMDIEWLSGKPRQIVNKPAYPPTYPPGYKGQLEGRIRLQFWVDADGFVIRVRPRQKLDPRLDAVATEYLRQYRFEPLKKSQGDKPQQGVIPFSFHLK